MTCHYTAKTAASVYGHDPAGAGAFAIFFFVQPCPYGGGGGGGGASLTGGEMLMPGVWPEEK